MLHDSFMSRANTLVVPGGKMELAMQLIFTPMILRLVERKKALARGVTMKDQTTREGKRREADGRCAARARDGRGGGGQLRPSGHADGHGRDRGGAVARHLKHDPADPRWADRDRFVLSNGHGSMLLYALLHLTGYDLPIEELKRFRQLHSKTPGHPEVGPRPGSRPPPARSGRGSPTRWAWRSPRSCSPREFNRPGHAIVDHRTWAFVGDGCLMEGISHEACSLAGTWGLAKLTVLYDDNGISIDGEVAGWFTDDTPARFEAYGWHVIRDVDGHDVAAVDRAIAEAKHGSPTSRR
jgi:transketolase N-terminal domain/subunit